MVSLGGGLGGREGGGDSGGRAGTHEAVFAFDSSDMAKGGERTERARFFWNGCAECAERGLEVNVLSCVDVTRTVFFFDPGLKQYFPIPYRRLAGPSMSLWELREVRRQLKAEGRNSLDEAALFAGYERLR